MAETSYEDMYPGEAELLAAFSNRYGVPPETVSSYIEECLSETPHNADASWDVLYFANHFARTTDLGWRGAIFRAVRSI